MIKDIVHTAVARKMLCKPVNNLIADTEFACAAGMLLRILRAEEAEYQRAAGLPDLLQLQSWLLEEYRERLEGEFDTPEQNLIEMLRDYRMEENPITAAHRELMEFGYRTEISYPKGRFL